VPARQEAAGWEWFSSSEIERRRVALGGQDGCFPHIHLSILYSTLLYSTPLYSTLHISCEGRQFEIAVQLGDRCDQPDHHFLPNWQPLSATKTIDSHGMDLERGWRGSIQNGPAWCIRINPCQKGSE
jgi:hypothetical protein